MVGECSEKSVNVFSGEDEIAEKVRLFEQKVCKDTDF